MFESIDLTFYRTKMCRSSTSYKWLGIKKKKNQQRFRQCRSVIKQAQLHSNNFTGSQKKFEKIRSKLHSKRRFSNENTYKKGLSEPKFVFLNR